jgi:aryl-alcohol dehydrogenase-like predicted oxidoreductase
MKKNRLGRSDLWVSEIGFGCMSLPSDQTEATKILHAALDSGVNFFDTADLYGRGENERLLGAAFKSRRSDVIIATKVGNRWIDGVEGWTWDASGAYIRQAVRESLRRLNTDYIDLYQLHGGTLEDDIDEVISTFEDLQREGLIRYYGISSIRPNVIREYVKRSNIVSVMMQYSILDRRPEETILDLLRDHEIHVIARGPVAKGMLSEKVFANPPTEPVLDYQPNEIQELVTRLSSLCDKGRSLSQLALRYTLSHPAVATVIPGASKLEQLMENVGAAHTEDLSAEELSLIRSWSKANRYTAHR